MVKCFFQKQLGYNATEKLSDYRLAYSNFAMVGSKIRVINLWCCHFTSETFPTPPDPDDNEVQLDSVAIDRELPWKQSCGAAVCDPHNDGSKLNRVTSLNGIFRFA